MEKIKRKIAWDDDGATSSGFQLLILIVIGLLVWEFGAGYIGIEPLSSYFDDLDFGFGGEPFDIGDLTFVVELYNENNMTYLETVPMPELIGNPTIDKIYNDIDTPGNSARDYSDYVIPSQTYCHNIEDNNALVDTQIRLSTNAPAKLWDSWSVEIDSAVWSYALIDFEADTYDCYNHDIIFGSGTQTYTWLIESDKAQVSGLFSEETLFQCRIRSPDGQIVEQIDILVW